MNRIVVTLGLAIVWSIAPAAQRASRPSPPGPAARASAARTERAVPFKVGETLTYEVSWPSYVVAGTATATVMAKKPSANSTAYYIVVEGRPMPILARLYNFYYKMDTLVDSFTLLSQRGTVYSEEGAEHQLAATRFDRTAQRAFFERHSEKTDKTDFPVPSLTQDGLAVLYALRTRTFRPGERFMTPIADSGALYTLQVDVGSLEQVKAPFGEFAAWDLKAGVTDAQGQAVWKNIAVWISNDARRLPVKLQAELPIGTFVLALRDAR